MLCISRDLDMSTNGVTRPFIAKQQTTLRFFYEFNHFVIFNHLPQPTHIISECRELLLKKNLSHKRLAANFLETDQTCKVSLGLKNNITQHLIGRP